MIILIACLTLADVKSAECNVACKYWGYDSGKYENNYCLCIDFKEYERTKETRIVLPKKSSRNKKEYID